MGPQDVDNGQEVRPMTTDMLQAPGEGNSLPADNQPEASAAPSSAPESQAFDLDAIIQQAANRMDRVPEGQPDSVREDSGQPDASKGEQSAPESKKHKFTADGQEIEVEESKLYELAAGGLNYTRKMQELAAERDKISAYQALTKRLETDPQFANSVIELLQPQQPQQAQQQTPPAHPEDPVQRIAWEAAQQARQQLMTELAPVLQRIQPLEHQVTVQRVIGDLQRDPLFDSVRQAIPAYIQSYPPSMQEVVAQRLNADPQALVEAYGHIRGVLERQGQGQANQAQSTPTTVKSSTPRPQAPQLEAPGGTVTPSKDADTAKRLKAVRGRITSGQANDADLASFLTLSGAVARMDRRG